MLDTGIQIFRITQYIIDLTNKIETPMENVIIISQSCTDDTDDMIQVRK
jgi:predicted membrane protein